MPATALDIKIRPGISPDARHQIEDTLLRKGYEVAGGGGYDDGSESDIMVYVSNVRSDLPAVIRILQKARIGRESVVLQTEPQRAEHPVYPDGEVLPPKPWWKVW
ncbi:MAG: hypothetical protein H6822_35275 [Planctomycetaceae bacterium]|nr:hypothetical protein [Planctomycetales bacterium]MCB9927449.1 hypothetical protein [Planctomycetaceae bacterium]